MQKACRSRVAVVMAVLAFAPPAAAQSRREMQMMADIRMLQEQTQQLQQQLAAALADLQAALETLNARVDEHATLNRKSFADQKLIIDQAGGDIRIIREKVDETNVRITGLSQEIEALRLSIPAFPSPTAPVDPAAAAAAGQTPAVPGAPPAPPAPIGAGISPQRLYDTAWADYTAGQWTLCIEGFSTYLRTFPRNEAADEAQFYIGECHYADGKYAEALDAYTRMIVNYPSGERVPDAYYKRALAFERMNQIDQAIESFQTVMKNYPDSAAARLAKQNVDRLARQKPGGAGH
ncbi:MAG: tetratricopeptide repeat protein [Acidobacteriota bacterium]